MGNSDIKYIHCGELEIAAGCEADTSKETTAYLPSSYLVFVEQGQLHIRIDQQFHIVSAGEYALIRKYTEATVYKSYKKEEGAAKTYFFALTNDFIRKIIKNIHIPNHLEPIADRIVPLESNSLLTALMNSIKNYVDTGDDLDPELVILKTKEALLAIIKSNPKYAAIFREYSMAERADIVQFMNYNYLENLPLETLAVQTGRCSGPRRKGRSRRRVEQLGNRGSGNRGSVSTSIPTTSEASRGLRSHVTKPEQNNTRRRTRRARCLIGSDGRSASALRVEMAIIKQG